MKNTFKITFFVSLAGIFLSVVFLARSVLSSANNRQGSIGIIGGADGPTALLVTQSLAYCNPIYIILCIAGVVLVASAIGWIAVRKKKQ